MPCRRSCRIGILVLVCLFAVHHAASHVQACDPNPDPMGLAGPRVVFMNNCTQGTSIVADNSHTREQAMNPYTPLRDPFGLRISDTDSKLKGATTADPVGDTLYIRGGTYEMPLINVFNRVVFWQEHNIKIKAYPGERVTIRGSTFLPGGNPPYTFCNPFPGQGLCIGNSLFQFAYSADVTVEGITFVGNTDTTISIDGTPVTGKLFNPFVLDFWQCDRLTLRDVSVKDYTSISDIGLGFRYLLDPAYVHTEHMARGLTVSYSTGLEMERVSIDGSPDDLTIVDQSSVPWDVVGFITESVLGSPSDPIHIHGCSFRDIAGNAVEFSTVINPQQHIVFENNDIDNWKCGVQIGGSGLSQHMILRNNKITYNHFKIGSWGNGGYGIKVTNAANITLANNVIYDGGLNGAGIEIIAGHVDITGQFYSISDISIVHNTLYRAGSQAISIRNAHHADGSIPANGITGTRVINNLIYKINPEFAQVSNLNNSKRELNLQFSNFEENGGYGNTFWNNLFVPERSDGLSIGSCDFGHWLANGSQNGSWMCYVDPLTPGCQWITCSINAGCGVPTRYKYTGASFNSLQPYVRNNIDATSTSPMFVNADDANFHLVSNSPAINHAVPLPEVPSDFDGVVRAQGGGCTIGAFEFDPPVIGDLTCDFQVSQSDIGGMVLALISPAVYSQSFGCLQNGDINQDQKVDGRDIRGFVEIILP